MLADFQPKKFHSGALDKSAQPDSLSLQALIGFIADELPRWRDRPDRQKKTAENALTAQLAAHLNSAARKSKGWDILQFRTEVPDEIQPGRTIDLTASPCAETVLVEGRGYGDFDMLMPIECKRLPTPSGAKRDEREYVFSDRSSTGGIQRFKAGAHGAAHIVGAMIAYIQSEPANVWHDRVCNWIQQLAADGQRGWSNDDIIYLDADKHEQSLSIYQSRHARFGTLSEINLTHLWIVM